MVQTIQQTSKKWNAVQRCGFWTALLGLTVCFITLAMVEPKRAVIAFFLGSACYLIGRVGAWWYHG